MERKQILCGFAVVVLDRGFVYVGYVTCDSEWCVIEKAHNIRTWGTTKGLGELTLGGPTEQTQLDAVGTVRAPIGSVCHLIDSEVTKWKMY
jgi:hypothetical protein